jgi:hypothetical protein
MYNRLKRHLTAHKDITRQLLDIIFRDRQPSVGHITDFANHFHRKPTLLCVFFMYDRLKGHLTAHKDITRQLLYIIFRDRQPFVGHITDFANHFH